MFCALAASPRLAFGLRGCNRLAQLCSTLTLYRVLHGGTVSACVLRVTPCALCTLFVVSCCTLLLSPFANGTIALQASLMTFLSRLVQVRTKHTEDGDSVSITEKRKTGRMYVQCILTRL
eukprot:6668273-Prymnesium_polylepis.2